MRDYKLYSLDGAGQIAGAAELLRAETDEQAIAIARATAQPLGCELWRGSRLVVRLKA